MILKHFFHRWVGVFTLSFIIFLPFPFFLFPKTGEWLRTVSESIGGGAIQSDSEALYWLVFWLLLASLVIAGSWTAIRKEMHEKFPKWLYLFVCYYLALILLKFGFDKLFLSHFYFLEPDTIFTPLGLLEPNTLHETSVGTAPKYSLFSGLIEIIVALLLLFKRTRRLGALLSVAVLTNLVMINLGFDLSAKLFSVFLLGLSIYLLGPDIPRFSHFIQGKGTTPQPLATPLPKNRRLFYWIAKPLLIGLMIVEGFGVYVMESNSAVDSELAEDLVGAYHVIDTVLERDGMADTTVTGPKRIFIRSDSYFITQAQNDEFSDAKLRVDYENSLFHLTHESGGKMTFPYFLTKSSDFTFLILQFDDPRGRQLIRCKKIQLFDLPIYQDGFHWTIDSAPKFEE